MDGFRGTYALVTEIRLAKSCLGEDGEMRTEFLPKYYVGIDTLPIVGRVSDEDEYKRFEEIAVLGGLAERVQGLRAAYKKD